MASITQGQLDWSIGATEWTVYPQNTFTQLGAHTSTCASTPPAYDMIGDYTSVDANGVADSLTAYAHFIGTIFTIDYDGNAGYSFYIHDGTGGINVYKSSDLGSYTAPERGDSIEVYGTIIQFNGLTEIAPDTINVLATGAATQNATVTTTLDEPQESELVRINNVSLVTPSQWTNSGSGFNVDVTNGTSTYVVRIDADCNLYGTAAPTGTFDVVGVGSQYDNSSPYTSGYQLFPRDTNDIIYGGTVSNLDAIGDYNNVDASGVADSLGVNARFQGTVFTIDFDGNAGYSLYIHDGTGGINIYKSTDIGSYTSPMMGDVIEVYGTIAQFNGLTELIPDSLTLVSMGGTIQTPTLASGLGEAQEQNSFASTTCLWSPLRSGPTAVRALTSTLPTVPTPTRCASTPTVTSTAQQRLPAYSTSSAWAASTTTAAPTPAATSSSPATPQISSPWWQRIQASALPWQLNLLWRAT